MKKKKRIFAFLMSVVLTLSMFVQSAAASETAVDVNDMQQLVYQDEESVMPYRLYVPEDYDSEEEYPVVVFLHGAGERGNDNTAQLIHAIQNLFDTHNQMKDAVVIAPQCPFGKRWVETDWAQGSYDSDAVETTQLNTVMKILDAVQNEYSTDSDRIYAVGVSMGGFGTWNLLMNHSDVFAAGIPICGGADPAKADILKDVPIWTFHGTADSAVPYSGTEEMVNAIRAAGGQKIIFTSYSGADHNIWNTAAESFGLIDWLFSQRLSARQDEMTWKGAEAEWSMDEGAGTAVSDNENQYSGQMTGGVSWGEGVRGTGLVFDGSGYVDLGFSDLSRNWTVSAWVKRGETAGDNSVLLAGPNSELKIDQWENTGKVGFTECGVADYTFEYSAPIGEWVQLTFVSDDRGTSLYVNGEFAETNSARINGPAARIGANIQNNPNNLGYFCGALDELRIYDRSLTDDEITALYHTDTEQPVEPESVGKKTLEYFLNSAKKHVADGDTDNCVQSVKDLFTEAIAEGEAVLADEKATREEVMSAAAKLMKAIQALDMKAGDKIDLEMAVELGDTIDLEKYVEAGRAEFIEAQTEAKDVLADGDAMQGDVDSAWNVLVDAMNNLRLKANKDALEALLDEVSTLDLESYTEESVTAFRSALAAAQAVFADNTLAEADQQKVDDAVTALSSARDVLVLKEGETETQNPDNGKNSSTDAGNNENNRSNTGADENADGSSNASAKAAKTGDESSFIWLLLLAAAGAAIVVTVKRRCER